MQLWTLVKTRFEHLLNERRTRAQIESRQIKKFRRLVRHAAAHSPYYQEIIHTRGIDVDRCVPQDFPILTKAEMTASFDRIVTDRTVTRQKIIEFLERSNDAIALYDGRYYVVRSSGTSGDVSFIVYSRGAWTCGVTGSFRAKPVLRLQKERLAFLASSGDHATGNTYALSVGRSFLRWVIDLEMFEINASLAVTIDGLNRFQPTILFGYPHGLAMLAEKQLEGRLRISPLQVRCSGEMLDSTTRELVQRAFSAPLCNFYVCTEHHTMGLSRGDDGMYLFEDDLIFEFAPDHTLITNLFNYTMPLIRYRLSDVLVPVQDESAAWPFTKVEVRGRVEHTPVFVNEHGKRDFISPHTIGNFLVRNVRRSQLKVEGPASCAFRLCLEPELDTRQREQALEEVQRQLAELFAQKQMRNVSCRLEVVDELLPDSRTGKFQPILPADNPEPAFN